MRRLPAALMEARGFAHVAAALVRGAASAARRRIDPARLESWEFRGFSQSHEDGIIDYLSQRMSRSDRSFLEIGSGYGVDGNTAWLAVARRFRGLFVEADPDRLEISRRLLRHAAPGIRYRSLRVTAENVGTLTQDLASPTPDVVSVDVDGIDPDLTRAMIGAGLRPKLLVVEYNSAFGPDRAVTVPYRPEINFRSAHPSGLYYGASIRAWKVALGRLGYAFVTVESSGVNAVFLDPAWFPPSFTAGLAGFDFRENRFQLATFGSGWEDQLAHIRHLPLVTVE